MPSYTSSTQVATTVGWLFYYFFLQQLLSVSVSNELALGQVRVCVYLLNGRELSVQLNFLTCSSCLLNLLVGKSPLQLQELLQPRKDLLQECGQGGNVFWCPTDFHLPEELWRYEKMICIRMDLTYIGNWTCAQDWVKCHEKLGISSRTSPCINVNRCFYVWKSKIFNKKHIAEAFLVLLQHWKS